MSVLIDTPVWSLALRRRTTRLAPFEHRCVEEWQRLVVTGQARIAGIVRQEILSGLREVRDFERLRARLAAFDDVPADTGDHERAAEFFNQCRSRGVTASAFDVLICALAVRYGLAIFTTDTDFQHYAKILPVRLHHIAAGAG